MEHKHGLSRSSRPVLEALDQCPPGSLSLFRLPEQILKRCKSPFRQGQVSVPLSYRQGFKQNLLPIQPQLSRSGRRLDQALLRPAQSIGFPLRLHKPLPIPFKAFQPRPGLIGIHQQELGPLWKPFTERNALGIKKAGPDEMISALQSSLQMGFGRFVQGADCPQMGPIVPGLLVDTFLRYRRSAG